MRDGSTIEAGYAVKAECDLPGCNAVINRGLAYRCGDANFDAGCGHFYCGDHHGFHDCPYCWRCGEELDPPVVSPNEPICDDCYHDETATA